MKKVWCTLLLLWGLQSWSQDNRYSVEAQYFYGNIMEHNPHISHLITGHPEGVILGFNRKTFGKKEWEARYNYPDVGYTFIYQDMKNPYLGDNFSAYAHLGFYFLDRNLQLKIGQGLALTTNPYHPDRNYINNAYGSRIMSSTFFSGSLQKENIFEGIGFQAGLSLIHYSNADWKSPNNSTNTIAVNIGLNYLFEHEEPITFIPASEEDFSEPVHYNFVLRGGANTIGIIGSKSYPFLTFSAYADKRLNRKSTIQAGAEFFLSGAMKEYISYRAIAFPEDGTMGDEDAKRAGLFAGHQLSFRKLSVITHLGYYFYYPYDKYVDRIYLRAGLQRPIYKDLFGSVTIRAHGNDAEAVELSVGYRL